MFCESLYAETVMMTWAAVFASMWVLCVLGWVYIHAGRGVRFHVRILLGSLLYRFFLQAARLISLQPEILAKNLAIPLQLPSLRLGLFLSKQLIFAKSCKNQLSHRYA